MAVSTEEDGRLPRIRVGDLDLTRPAVCCAIIAVSLIVFSALGGTQVFPESITTRFAFVEWVNQAEDWLKENYRWLTRAISSAILAVLDPLEERLWLTPWPVIILAFALPALAYSGLRLALFSVFGVLIWAGFGMWDDAMTTLSMMIVAVVLCVLCGGALGVLCARSDRIEAIVRPILDTMQVMPAFVYLLPAIFFFGTNPASATIAVMIYAFPPIVRLTNLGLRQVPANMIEAAESFGTTRLQMLTKVQIPQAMPSILLGINQTIMMALALAVFSTFVGAGGGLGDQVWKAITKLKVGWSLEAGLCIVTMAIIFDRLSQAMSRPAEAMPLAPGEMRFHLLPQSWEPFPPARWIEHGIALIWRVAGWPVGMIRKHGPDWLAERAFLAVSLGLILIILAVDAWIAPIGDYPRDWRFRIRGPVDDAIDWLTVNPAFIVITKTLRAVIYLYFLNPLDVFLTGMPWWYTMALCTAAAWFAAGWRLALAVFLSLLFAGAAGLWGLVMYTFAGTAVSVFFCVLIGLPLGIWAANSRLVEAVLRPILDLMQTIPTFVYLIPALFFFGGNPTTAIFATVIYAIPPVIRTTTLGLRQVPAELGEVATAFGTGPLQALWKVRLPLASPSIMLGINQTVIMALAMQTVTPLIGGLGLGKEVYDAMNTANTGKGLAAGICIALMAILLDRVSNAINANQRRALGLA